MVNNRLVLMLIICSLMFSNCGQEGSQQLIPKKTKPSLYALKDKFKYQDLQEFRIDTFGFGNRSGHYVEVDSSAFKLIFQEGGREYMRQGDERDYYYSWQNRDSSFIEFVILSQDEDGYCSVLRYYIFDRKGRFISKFDLAASCGDAGWVFEGEGRKIGSNDFETVTVEANSSEGNVGEKESQEGDSTRCLIQLTPVGTLIKKEIFKKHFVEK